MRKKYQTIIIGAGASGLMLASQLENKNDLLLIDANPKMGAKISLSGGGKCNISNSSVGSENYLAKDWFVESVLSRFDNIATLEWFKKRGLIPALRERGQYFCKKNSNEVLDIFRRELIGVDFAFSTRAIEVHKENSEFIIHTKQGTYLSDNLIVATGALSFPLLGASDIGYKIAEGFGHTIMPYSEALVGLTLQPEQFFFKELSGTSVEVVIKNEVKSFDGNLLFAHRGISGPAVLNTSLYWHKGEIEIDFVPGFNWNIFTNSKKQISTLLPLPKKVAKVFMREFDIPDNPAYKMTDIQLERLKSLSSYHFAPAGTFGYKKAEVTRGGVSTDEIDPYNMMSLKEDNLYFVGEVMDVTGELGGYNFQWAFSSAHACSQYLGVC